MSSSTHCGPRVGYLLRTYPRISQTFVVNEILAVEQQGLPLAIASLRRPSDGVFHDSICRVAASVDYLSEPKGGTLERTRRAGGQRRGADVFDRARALRAAVRDPAVSWDECLQAGLLVEWARKRRVEHVHVHFGTQEATVAWLAALAGGPGFSLTLHAFDIFRNNVNRPLLARKINASRFTVTVCESNRAFMMAHLPGLDAARVRVLYNGIDLDRFAFHGEPREPGFVFAVGRLIEKKGFDHLIRAVGALHARGVAVRCEIAGDGGEERRLRTAIQQLGLQQHVRLVGVLRQHQIQERLRQAACLALPCIEARDGNVDALPTVLLEALASGCPAVSTRLSGIPEIIEHGVSGLLVAPGDVAGLADALGQVLADAALAARLAQAGRARAEQRFDGRRAAATLADWFTEAARQGGAARPPRPAASSEPVLQAGPRAVDPRAAEAHSQRRVAEVA